MKTRVAMLFGGKSVEHEVSVISGIQAVMNMDTDKYEVIPVYMTKRNEMYIGEEIGKIESYKNIDELLKKVPESHYDQRGRQGIPDSFPGEAVRWEETGRDRCGFPRSSRYQRRGRCFPGLSEDHGDPLRGL